MARGIQFTKKAPKQAARQEHFEWRRLKCVGEIILINELKLKSQSKEMYGKSICHNQTFEWNRRMCPVFPEEHSCIS